MRARGAQDADTPHPMTRAPRVSPGAATLSRAGAMFGADTFIVRIAPRRRGNFRFEAPRCKRLALHDGPSGGTSGLRR